MRKLGKYLTVPGPSVPTPPQVFGSYVNHISIRGGADYAHRNSTCPLPPDFQTFLRLCVGSEVLDHAHGSAIICTRVIVIMMKVKNAHHLIIKWYRSLISIPYRNSTYAFRSLHCMTHLMRNIFFPSSKDDSLKIDTIQRKRTKVGIVIIDQKIGIIKKLCKICM
jgi:hypothetical protein